MLKEVKHNDKYNVFDTEKSKNILGKDYDYIRIQNYGIVARNNDTKYQLFDVYNMNGKLLFSKKLDTETNYHFWIEKNYVQKSYVDKNKTLNTDYYHLDGHKIEVEYVKGVFEAGTNLIFMTNDRNEIYYDVVKRKIIAKKSDFVSDLEQYVEQINSNSSETKCGLKVIYGILSKALVIKLLINSNTNSHNEEKFDLFSMDYSTFKPKLYADNITKFKNLYKAKTGKKCTLKLETLLLNDVESLEL